MNDEPFGGLPFFGDLAKLLGQQGAISWDAARQLAIAVATDGQPEGNVDPIERIRLEELGRVADIHVSAVLGLPGKAATIVAVTPGAWAVRSLEAYRHLFEALGAALAAAPPAEGDEQDPTAAFMGGLMKLLTPSLLGLAAGSMVGHLARRSFGGYDLPIPRPPDDDLLIVASALSEFASDWSVPIDDLRLFVASHELTHHAIMDVPHVRAELTRLLTGYARSFRPDPRALEDRLGEVEIGDPNAMAQLQRALSDPEVILGALTTPEQQSTRDRLDALVAVIVGVVDHVLDAVGQRVIASYGSLSEAVRRQRITPNQSDVFVQRLLGLSLGREQVERGAAFVRGVIERAGDDGLGRLWSSVEHLPTPNEVDAPGLWLARIEYN